MNWKKLLSLNLAVLLLLGTMMPIAEAAAEWKFIFHKNIENEPEQAVEYVTHSNLKLYEVMPVFDRDGYAMTGYNSQPDGQGTNFDFCETFKQYLPDDENETVDLYAQWTQAKDYHVLYVGGVTESGKSYYLEDNLSSGKYQLATESTFEIDDYDRKVVAWESEVDETIYLPQEEIELINNMVFRAQVGAKAIRLHYLNRKHEWENAIQIYYNNYSTIYRPQQDEYFTGWNTKKDGSGTAFTPDDYAVDAPDELFAQYVTVPEGEYCLLMLDGDSGNYQIEEIIDGKIKLPDEINGTPVAFWRSSSSQYYPCGLEVEVEAGDELHGQPINEDEYYYIANGNGGTAKRGSQYMAGKAHSSFIQLDKFEKNYSALIGFRGEKTGELYLLSDDLQKACEKEANENRIAMFSAEYISVSGDYILYFGNGLKTEDGMGYYLQDGLNFETSAPTAIENPFILPAGKHFFGWGDSMNADEISYFPSDTLDSYENKYYAKSGRTCLIYHEINEDGKVKIRNSIDNICASYPHGGGIRKDALFSGWNTAEDGSGKWYIPGDTVIFENNNPVLNFYSQWEYFPKNGYYYALFGNRFGGNKYAQVILMENATEKIILPSSVEGTHPAIGWYEENEHIKNKTFDSPYVHLLGSEVNVSSGTIFAPIMEEYNIITVYHSSLPANTIEKEQRIFYANTSGNNLELYSADKVFGTTPDNKEFDSWNTAADGSGTSYKAGDKVSPGLYELFAQWIDKAVDIVKPSKPSTSTDSSSDTKKSISVSDSDHGDVSISPKKATKGKTVTITVEPDDGYEVDEVYVTDKNGKSIKVKDKGNGKYTFTMPDSKVEIEVTYTAVNEITTIITTPPIVFATNYTDVSLNDWFASAVQYVSSTGLMQGNNGSFTPEVSMTRGMMAQILYNREGNGVHFGTTFPDVSAQAWYADAAAWSAANQIFSGYDNGMFGADDPITREQLAVILYNYARAKGYNISAVGELAVFTDGVSVSSYAQTAMRWAIGAGLMQGNNAYINPQMPATRAEVAVILQQFFTAIVH